MMTPTDIRVRQKAKLVDIRYPDGSQHAITFATLRQHSPSAANKSTREVDYSAINIIGLDPVGNYGVKFIFDDGHDTGIYRFELLYQLACGKD